MLAYWLFGVVCRFVDIDGGETLFDVVQEEGEGGLRHSTVRVVGVWYLTFSWSLYQSQSIASFGGLAAILSLSRISTQPETDLSFSTLAENAFKLLSVTGYVCYKASSYFQRSFLT